MLGLGSRLLDFERSPSWLPPLDGTQSPTTAPYGVPPYIMSMQQDLSWLFPDGIPRAYGTADPLGYNPPFMPAMGSAGSLVGDA